MKKFSVTRSDTKIGRGFLLSGIKKNRRLRRQDGSMLILTFFGFYYLLILTQRRERRRGAEKSRKDKFFIHFAPLRLPASRASALIKRELNPIKYRV